MSDFDGTLVCTDILDVLCGITGHKEESRKLNEEFIAGKREDLPTLKKRIDFLSGVTIKQINAKLDEQNFLVDGAIEFFKYLKSKGYITILHSGNLLPVLEYYKDLLKLDYVVGNTPRMNGDTILGIEIEDFTSENFKADGCRKIITEIGVSKRNIIAVGDSPSDKAVFDLAGIRIAFNPKGGIEEDADFVLQHNLLELIPYLEKHDN